MLKSFKRLKNQRGSFTVEATITFTSVILAIIVLIYICSLLYQQSLLKSIAQKAAISGATVWVDAKKDMYIGAIYKEEMNEESLYGSVIDLDKEEKQQKVIAMIKGMLGTKNVFKNENISVSCDVETNLLGQKTLTVEILQKYEIPLGSLLETMGFSKYFTLTEKAKAYINHPAEVIRNSDILFERFTK